MGNTSAKALTKVLDGHNDQDQKKEMEGLEKLFKDFDKNKSGVLDGV